MSAKKSDTKIPEKVNPDSGYLSGPVDYVHEEEDLSEIVLPDPDGGSKVSSDVRKDEFDSGVVCLADHLARTGLEESELALPPLPPLPQIQLNEIPPVELLFQQDEDGDTQLHIATVHSCEKLVGVLLRVCPNKEWLNIPNIYGLTALHVSVMIRNAKITRMLVLAGANIACRDNRGETPLHKATAMEDTICMQALLNPAPELPPTKIAPVIEQKNYNGQGCIHMAATMGNMQTLQTLVRAGANIQSYEHLAGRTALHIAAARGDAAMCQFLVRHEAAAAEARDYGGRSPRRLARRTRAAAAFDYEHDDESETDDDDMPDSEIEAWFRETSKTINVA